MLPNIKNLLVLLLITCLITSCTSFQEENKQKRVLSNSAYLNTPLPELTTEQRIAFDALNQLQARTDQMNRLYSTFANLDQPCYPADTTFEISQSELLFVMQQFIAKHCKKVTPELQNELAQASVLAQMKYTVLHCSENKSNVNNEKGLSMTGRWVLPNILGRRDVILVW